MRNNKAIIYSDTITQLDGGGFNYVQAVNDFMISKGYQTKVVGNEEVKLKKVSSSWERMLKNIPIVRSLRNATNDLLHYKVVVIKSNFIPALCLSPNSILIVDFPFQQYLNVADRIKLKTIGNVICNSGYTASWIRQYWGVEAKVIYPTGLKPKNLSKESKKKNILSVGRFLNQGRSKRQDVLIKSFKSLCDNGLKDYTLYLAGFVQDNETLKRLKKMATNYPVIFIEHASNAEIQNLYEDATYYWHACGYEADLKSNPSAAEHYGIAVADALTFGCVSMVFGVGGPAEIVGNGAYGEVWFTPEELEQKMFNYLSNPELVDTMSRKAKNRSKVFSEIEFNKQLEEILKL